MENEGIEYLRTYLHLPSEIVPSTLKRATRSEPARARPSAPARSGDASKTGEDRSAYRRAPGNANAEKKADVGPGAVDVEFVSICKSICNKKIDHQAAYRQSANLSCAGPNGALHCVINRSHSSMFSFHFVSSTCSVVDSVVDQDPNR